MDRAELSKVLGDLVPLSLLQEDLDCSASEQDPRNLYPVYQTVPKQSRALISS